jgi:hypothetical protein
MISLRRLIVFLCVVAVLLAAMSPAASGLHCAILVPLLLCVAVIVLTAMDRGSDEVCLPVFPVLSSLSSRAPPSA